MRRAWIFAIFAVATFVGAGCLSKPDATVPQTQSSPTTMKLESPVFASGGAIPSVYTCDDRNVSPQLLISGVPSGAKSLALILHDPDAKSDFVHWTMWNLDPATTVVTEGGPPATAILGRIGSGKQGYTGPCPPSGTHHYVFELFALDDLLTIDATTDAAGLRAAMQGHVLETTTLTGTYARH